MTNSDIRWSSKERQTLHGWRTSHEDDPPDAAPTLAEAWARIRAVSLPAFKGDVSAANALRKEQKQAQPPKQLKVREEILRAALVFSPPSVKWQAWENWDTARALVALWTEVGGFRFAVDVLSSQPTFHVMTMMFNGVVTGMTIQDDEPETDNARGPFSLPAELEPLWWALRCRVSVMSDEELAKACASCEDLLDGVPAGKPPSSVSTQEGGHWWRRAMLTFVLSRNTSLAAEQIDLLLEAVGKSEWGGAELLVAAAPDVARATAVAKRAMANSMLRMGVYAFDVVEALGSDAAPLLEQTYAHARKVSSAIYLVDHQRALGIAHGKQLPGAKRLPPRAKKAPAPAAKKAPAPAAKKTPAHAARKPAAKKPAPAAKKPAPKKKAKAKKKAPAKKKPAR